MPFQHRKPNQKKEGNTIPSSSPSSKVVTVKVSFSQTVPTVSPPAKTTNPLFIPLPTDDVVNLASSDKSSAKLLKDGEVDASKDLSDFLKDTDMAGVVSEGVVPASATKQVPKKGGAGFTNVDMIDPVKNVSNNTAANARTSFKSLVLNKIITSI